MKKKLHYLCLCGALMLPLGSVAQLALDETQVPENADNEPAPVHPVPSERQLLWNETEFYGFFHYGMTQAKSGVTEMREKLLLLPLRFRIPSNGSRHVRKRG